MSQFSSWISLGTNWTRVTVNNIDLVYKFYIAVCVRERHHTTFQLDKSRILIKVTIYVMMSVQQVYKKTNIQMKV